MRRNVIKAALIGALALVAGGTGLSAVAAEQVKVVYHMMEGIEQSGRALGNIRNHLQADPQAKIVVVAIGEGVQFLVEGAKDRNGKPFEPAVSALTKQGVEFRICNNTLNNHNIPTSKVLPEAKIVPSGVAEVARLQAREGYAYLRP